MKDAVVTLSFVVLDVDFDPAAEADDPNLPDPAGINDRASGNALEPTAGDDKMSSMKGEFGTLTVNKYTGEWTYVLDNADVHSQALDSGDTEFDVFQIVIIDEEGAMVVKSVRIRVNGEDDASILYLEHDLDPGEDPQTRKDDDYAVSEKGSRAPDAPGGVEEVNRRGGEVTVVEPADPPGARASGTFGVYDHDGEDAAFLAHAPTADGRAQRVNDNSEHFTFWAMSGIAAGNHVASDSTPRSNGNAAAVDASTVGTAQKNNDHFTSGWAVGKFGWLTIDRDGEWVYVLAEVGADFAGTGLAGGGNVDGDLAVHLGLLTQAQVDAGDTVTKAAARQRIIDRVSKLNHNDAREEHFAVKVQDGSELDSNIIELTLTVTGANDAQWMKAVRTVSPEDDTVVQGGLLTGEVTEHRSGGKEFPEFNTADKAGDGLRILQARNREIAAQNKERESPGGADSLMRSFNDAFAGTGLAGSGNVDGDLAVHLGLLTQAQVDAGDTITKAAARQQIIAFDDDGDFAGSSLDGGGNLDGALAVQLGLMTQEQRDAGVTITKATARQRIINFDNPLTKSVSGFLTYDDVDAADDLATLGLKVRFDHDPSAEDHESWMQRF